MAQVVALPPSPETRAANAGSFIGIIVALGSWAMMFSALFFVYAALRTQSPTWPPAGVPRLPASLPTVSTAVIVASSVTLQLAVAALRRGNRAMFQRLLAVTLFLGLGFLEAQWLVWGELRALGVYLSNGIYGSIVLGFTYLHALHIVVGLGALLFVWIRARRGNYGPHDWFGVRSVAYFWHFVDAVWLVMFVTLFLV
ncbi:MAG: cytochrome c oxidase subunit 3 [Polyangiales bacterium]